MTSNASLYDLPALETRPEQPPENEWGFVEDLKRPVHSPPAWTARKPRSDEADLRGGVAIQADFDDPLGRLDTAYADFRTFLEVCGIEQKQGGFVLRIAYIPVKLREAYRIRVSEGECVLEAGDSDGVRRGLVTIEDAVLGAGGPFLPLGTIERYPVIRTRISRCFFGPIKRPPKNRDELLDDVDYYPESYLNRLAHEGINGLWISIAFADLCPLKPTPEAMELARRRFAKLKATSDRCLRYGIRVFPFCIEPAAIPEDSPVLAEHPGMIGHRSGGSVRVCVSTQEGRQYLENTVRTIFETVPGLGGLINISVGERPTLCCNAPDNNCPRCVDRKPWDVLADSLAAMKRGMAAVNPEAEMISWAYIPNNGTGGRGWGEAAYREAAAHIPPGVILQHNFESNGGKMQLGRWRRAGDYWLSYIGPSPRFRACTRRALDAETRMFAKLQVGCSHEVASVPFVPVPGNLYRKYEKMHKLGVSGAMQCWYFGNYPGVMNKAAGELSFAPFPVFERTFLKRLASRDWGDAADEVVRAWNHFSRAYANYPLTNLFGYYGPMHDGPVWPLYLVPRDLPLSPTWKLDEYWPSGDRIGECIAGTHTLSEALTLCRRMSDGWNRGLRKLLPLRSTLAAESDRMRDIGLAEALGIQFESGANILEFYSLREFLTWQDLTPSVGREILGRLRRLVDRELVLDDRLIQLARDDRRLGFHSEAEGYKYFPERIEWRKRQLRTLLDVEFPQVEARLRDGGPLFPDFTGVRPAAPTYHAPFRPRKPADADGMTTEVQPAPSPDEPLDDTARWCAWYDETELHIQVALTEKPSRTIEVRTEPRRLWPPLKFLAFADGRSDCWQVGTQLNSGWQVQETNRNGCRVTEFRISRALLERTGPAPRPLRLNVIAAGAAWLNLHPLTPRLRHGTDNPADYGWILFGSR
jgi:hypothetical protein